MKAQTQLEDGVIQRANRRFYFQFVALIVLFVLLVGAVAAPSVALADPGDDLISAGIQKQQSGDYAGAISTLDSFIAQYPDSPNRNKAELYAGYSGLQLAASGDSSAVAKARSRFEYIIKQGQKAPYYREATFHNGRSYFDAEAYSTAKSIFEGFVKDYPTDAYNQYVYYYLGVCESRLGETGAATAYFDQDLKEFPESPLRWLCRMEKIEIVAKSGAYADAERQLAEMAREPDVPLETAGQIAVQRALLRVVQEDFDGAIAILEETITKFRSDPAAAEIVQDARLYEAYCYFAKQDFQRALTIVETMERESSTIAPETALLKIKILIYVDRIDEAETLLNKLAASTYGVQTPDAISAYRALIALARGKWDSAIETLVSTLKVRASSTNRGAIVVGYVDDLAAGTNSTGKTLLAPHDVVEACGTLILAYASRYAATQNQNDATAQLAIFQATSDYARSLDNPGIDLIVQSIDARRQEALKKPITSPSAAVSVSTPTGGNATPPTPGAVPNPNDPNASVAPGLNGQTGQGGTSGQNGQTGQIGTTGQNGQTTPAPNEAPNELYGARRPDGSADPNASTNPGAPANPANPADPNNPNAQAQPGATGTGANGTGANGAGTPAAGAAASESKPLTSAEASAVLERATTYYVNREFERADEALLGAMTASESFWRDVPGEAARIALLRTTVLFALDKRTEAQLMCQEIVANAPYSKEAAVANFYLGYGADYVGRRDDAIKYLKLAADAGSDSPFADAALYYLGTNEWERRNVAGAQQAFARLCGNYPNSAYWSHSMWALAQIESDARNDAVAEEIVDEALRRKPDAAIVDYLLFLKGEIALRTKDYARARVAFETIVDQYPNGETVAKAKNRLAAIPARFRDAELTGTGTGAGIGTGKGTGAISSSADASTGKTGRAATPTSIPASGRTEPGRVEAGRPGFAADPSAGTRSYGAPPSGFDASRGAPSSGLSELDARRPTGAPNVGAGSGFGTGNGSDSAVGTPPPAPRDASTGTPSAVLAPRRRVELTFAGDSLGLY